MNKLKICSVFSGCGGMDLGAIGGFSYQGKYYDSNSSEIVFSSDIDPYAVEIYNDNFDHISMLGDIRDLKPFVPKHDVLIGGFPCQSFSVVAQNPPRLGYKNDNGKLFFEMVDILKKHKPKVFIAENVKGLLSANKKQAFPLVIQSFEEAGYTCKYTILNSSHFGVPQKRERVFIVGFLNPELAKSFSFPTAIKSDITLQDVLENEDEVDSKFFFSQKAIDGMLKKRETMNKGRVQDPTGYCNTISAHLSKASLNSVDPVLCINGRYRRFTPLEAARIQSFPENFKFNVSNTRAYKAIGNAVPPVMMWHVMSSVVSTLSSAVSIKAA
ncbi:DNA (cytosine-5-)-methyltransferase [Vibrio parahaemolyticus]|uniref:DNA (cytosine-5-)-methyltransferase n=1 Tax=Vibrio parahaemolyticus TaxID=670 RepID=UPI000C86A4E5|nr:DNA (cytosine-5-)-methyltransferase [Vibrio parahaemolyticus]MDG3058867.1 DNA (cytosine-5-)-methyltransferase [Vibrio parahaemolyticus]PMS40161.1 DNA (cytosine-5-)-methyltransferase [Vibrio parahaemolyticus]PMS60933.1 DNA (cytosine-5-)-methyltransferase [Vibrio parahaemolyticus]PMS66417.1 DNA (cytosine-5-)-methyltransferase [Vibrio parahaemolyticus]PMS71314.1 DNA (cytosine-5-)-methyltransferase [Vibrio parahaemolyticus]